MKTAKTSSRGAGKTSKDRKRGRAKVRAAPVRKARAVVVVSDPSAPAARGIEVVVPGARAGADRAATAAEAETQVRSLDEHGRIARSSRALAPGQTHAIETVRGGRRKLVRKRFSAT
jgi:hypothetical protein